MRSFGYALAAAVALVGGVRLLAGGDDARAIIDKAIKAHGGQANLAKFQSQSIKGTGTFYGMGDDGIPFTGEFAFNGIDQSRFFVSATVGGQTFKILRILNKDKGWIKINDEQAQEMNKDQLAEERHNNYAGWVTSLAPLGDKTFKLAAIGEVKVGDVAAIGVRVSKEGQRDISLYFDKAKGLLIKSERMMRDVDGGDKEMSEEVLYSNYKEVEGSQQPTKLLIKRDGKRFVEAEANEIRAQKLDPSLFARP
jgi:hypothetical protein